MEVAQHILSPVPWDVSGVVLDVLCMSARCSGVYQHGLFDAISS